MVDAEVSTPEPEQTPLTEVTQQRGTSRRVSKASRKASVQLARAEAYKVVRELARGAFGVAYVVEEKASGALYVLKRVRLARQAPAQRKASMLEMTLLSQFQHPFIVGYKDSWIESGCVVCIVLEYGNLGDLKSRLEALRGAYLDEKHIMQMFVQLALALQQLRKKKVLHRDLKPANIFVNDEGKVMLGDFGLAVAFEEGHEFADRVVGTPNYMSPELFSNDKYSYPSDVWALGCVLYEMAALKPAFSSFDIPGLVKKVTQGPAPAPPKHFSSPFRALVRWVLTRAAHDRPTLEELLSSEFVQPFAQEQREHVRVRTRDPKPLPPVPDPNKMIREWEEHKRVRDQEAKQRERLASSKPWRTGRDLLATNSKLSSKGAPRHTAATHASLAPPDAAEPASADVSPERLPTLARARAAPKKGRSASARGYKHKTRKPSKTKAKVVADVQDADVEVHLPSRASGEPHTHPPHGLEAQPRHEHLPLVSELDGSQNEDSHVQVSATPRVRSNGRIALPDNPLGESPSFRLPVARQVSGGTSKRDSPATWNDDPVCRNSVDSRPRVVVKADTSHKGLKPMGEGTNTSSHAPSSRHQMKLTSKSVLEFDCSPLMNGRSTLKPIDLQQSDIDRRAVEKLGNGKSALLSAYANQLVPRLNRSEGPRPCRPRALPRINGHGVEPSPGPIEDDYTNTAWWLQQKHRMLQKVYGGLRA
mmetsp:Transcript_17583/g.33617  ORF Transcript_17583/g.33617 Transcript_17583/m.33617 type:complete len:705 (+) Transcript_17583:398-2512(+)|eukprot:CAMPEP_0114237288 /NCGR_PEP_ID=MMETSP0058-20121206/7304_1 /TAXON_ID=36894 /ORGANISM="Pyramimonas parkeae, CCMP726" /LENGTH=704 /DNA_ID=CAMNT_0001349307 /DNA_START=571 /DNA_END=2685 /DNA_ORIENTATION=-